MDVPQEAFVKTIFHDSKSFWQRKRLIVSSTTIPLQLQILKETGRYDAFKLEWNPVYSDPPDHPPVPNHLFWDSDVGKWIEGACYFLEDDTLQDGAQSIQAAIEELVSMIEKAQQPDGYLNIHFTVVDPKGRFTNLRDLHELYNAGHLIEGALAQNRWSGKTDLLNCVNRYTDLMSKTFGDAQSQIHGYPGHPEIELALLRLYRRTKNPDHLKLATYFITERGNSTGQDGEHYYDVEARNRGESPDSMPSYYPAPRSYWYQQAHKPIVKQDTIEGHSVRAMYLLTAVADLLVLTGTDRPEAAELQQGLTTLWENMFNKKMYMTGGIGAIKKWEGFGPDYFLPQSTDEGGCYAETCAAIGVMMLAERLLKLDANSHYADVLELCLYNAMLGGISLDGKKFTYENQLASSEAQPSTRHDWFTCACCPPNVCRVFGYLGGFLWSSTELPQQDAIEVIVHAYATAIHRVNNDIQLIQETSWPWEGRVSFQLQNATKRKITIKLRIPDYIENWTLTPAHPKSHIDKGYLVLDSEYLSSNQHFTMDLPLRPRLLRPDPRTKQNIVALARGPIVYCLEDIDNNWVADHFRSLRVDPDLMLANVEEIWNTSAFKDEPFMQLTVRNAVSSCESMNSTTNGDHSSRRDLNFVPFYLRANRGGRGHMRVGLSVSQGESTAQNRWW